MTNYDWVLFDLDETLVDFPAKKALALTLTDYGIVADEALMADYQQLNHRLWQQYNAGEIDSLQLQAQRFTLFANQADIAPLVMNERFLQHIIALSEPLDGVIETLTQLKGLVAMGIITNGFSLPQRGRLEKLGWQSWFSPLVISDEVKAAKPDRAIFFHTLAQMGAIDPRRVLMVGDNLATDIAGAQGAGLATCWFNPQQQIHPHNACHEIQHFSQLLALI